MNLEQFMVKFAAVANRFGLDPSGRIRTKRIPLGSYRIMCPLEVVINRSMHIDTIGKGLYGVAAKAGITNDLVTLIIHAADNATRTEEESTIRLRMLALMDLG